MLLDRLERGQGGRVFWKPFYRRSDFDDERYRPMFTPLADAGQVVKFKLWLDPWNGDGNLRVAPYVRRAMSGEIVETGAWHVPSSEGWQDYEFQIPEGDEAIDEIGVLVEYFGRLKFLGRLFLSDFSVSGKGRLAIDPKLEKPEWGGITRFTWNRGHWSLQDGVIHAHTAEDADAWTGNAYLAGRDGDGGAHAARRQVAPRRGARAGDEPLLRGRDRERRGGDRETGPRRDGAGAGSVRQQAGRDA